MFYTIFCLGIKKQFEHFVEKTGKSLEEIEYEFKSFLFVLLYKEKKI
jgi:hypothetical protein